ncbi:ribosome small subunit-dependent GTPase A [Agrilactobacillus yilanensis]|uniref:Small ribosomal subunit biogenesis GTPase RsgA n=1 Tax=Agrilactobacillus yilanensis TaxID=2485997 RepID=A0ABW4J9C4_9LACO|nr:ribosome small subunit-dependent GTPase A [Agrilactobacillus yilanensis]
MKGQGRIVKLIGGFYYVENKDTIYQTRARGNFRKKGLKPIVGDDVIFESTSLEDGYILELLPRRNALVRPPVANIDLVITVTSLKGPDFQANLLDRLLIAQHFAGIKTLIYITKGDLISTTEFAKYQQFLNYYQKIGYPLIMAPEAFKPEKLTALQAQLGTQTAVVTGQSGAGKSTLLNHLEPQLALATNEISKSLNRGKHTTRQVELMKVGAGWIADTPGFSSLSITQIPLTALKDHFIDFAALSDQCRFRGCQHVNEPNCAVKAAVAEGTILQARYDNYLQFRTEIAAQDKHQYKKK